MFALQHTLYASRHNTLFAIAAIVGHDDHLVAGGAHLLFQNNEFLGAPGKQRNHAVACRLEGLHNGQHGCHTHATTGTHHGAIVLYVSRFTKGPYDIGNAVALLQMAEFGARHAHLLHHQRDGAGLHIGLGYGERHAFAMLPHPHDDKVACLACTGYERGLHHEAKYFL